MTTRRYLTPYHLAVVGKFTLIGPAIGVLAALLFDAPNLLANLKSDFLFVFLLFGYIYGAVPALFAGLLYTMAWDVKAYFRRLTVVQFGLLLGAVTGLVAFTAFAALAVPKGVPEDVLVYLLPMTAGAACGALVARERAQSLGTIKDEDRADG